MNRYHLIYSNYLAKIQSINRPWPWPAPISSSGQLIEFEFKPREFSFEGLQHQLIRYKPAFEVKIQEADKTTLTKFYIDVSGTKYALEMKEVRRLIKFFPDEMVIIVDRKFFDNKSNIAKLKKLGVWEVKSKKEKPVEIIPEPLEKNAEGLVIVKTLDHIEAAAQLQTIYVCGICPQCQAPETMLLINARYFIQKGCQACFSPVNLPVQSEVVIEPIETDILDPLDFVNK